MNGYQALKQGTEVILTNNVTHPSTGVGYYGFIMQPDTLTSIKTSLTIVRNYSFYLIFFQINT